jgi:hypothetical protein
MSDQNHDRTDDSAPSDETLGSSRPVEQPGLQKDPSEWVSGDDPMTDAQRSYLDTLARQAGEELPADLTKAQASEHIDRLRAATGQEEGSGEADPGGEDPQGTR